MIRQDTAGCNNGMNAGVLDAIYLQFDHAIIEQQHIAMLYVRVQRIQCDADAFLAAVIMTKRAIKKETHRHRQA